MSKTATEWLFEQLWDSPKDKLTWNAILEQAKEIHRQQYIEDMRIIQSIDDVDFDGNVTFIINNIEQYYIDTYGE